jgi:hypothetical protein
MSKPRISYPGGCSRRPGDLKYCGPSKPRLSELSDEARRVLAAEALGWRFDHRREKGVEPNGTNWKYVNYPCPGTCAVPDFDQSADDAMKLAKNLKSLGRDVSLHTDGDTWLASTYFLKERPNGDMYEQDEAEVTEPTLPRALTSCFLLAKGLATE